MKARDSFLLSLLRSIGLLLVCGGGLLVVAGLLYWAMGWRYGGVVALWAAAWGLPFIGLGTGLAWMNQRLAGVAAIICAAAAIGLLALDGFALWSWLPATTAGAAILLGLAILIVNRGRVT